MTETSEIIKSATKNSLVILDGEKRLMFSSHNLTTTPAELGRGTSTFDGVRSSPSLVDVSAHFHRWPLRARSLNISPL